MKCVDSIMNSELLCLLYCLLLHHLIKPSRGGFVSVNFIFKGTVRPDWICMRVVPLESPLKGHQPLYVFDFLISVLNIWNNFRVLSRFMQNWTQPPACSDHGLHRILSSNWLAHCYLMKKITKVHLYFGLNCGMMKFFTCEPQSKEQLMPVPHL